MNQVLDLPILGLDTEFPDQLVILQQNNTDRFGCYCHEGVHGLACFSEEARALGFADRNDLQGMACLEVSFDEAREIAKNRPMPVVALILLDRLDAPQIHYVR